MRVMLDVEIYLKLGGIVAEKIWLDRLVDLNYSMKFMTISKSIERIEMEGHHHQNEEKQPATSYDPHIWLSPSNVKKMGAQILWHFLESMSKNEVLLNKNYEKFISDVVETDSDIKKILSESDRSKGFLVFHPAGVTLQEIMVWARSQLSLKAKNQAQGN